MSEQMELSDILSGSTPEGAPIAKPEPVAPEPVAAEAIATEATETPEPKPERNISRKKAFQQKERDEREAGAGRVRDPETGQYVAKEAAKAEPAPEAALEAPAAEAKPAPQQPVKEQPKQEFTDKERAFLAAAQEERRKRQALEAQLAQLQQQPPAEKKSFWDDPEAALAASEQKVNEAILKTRLGTAEAIARTKYSDFDANIAEFGELMNNVPGVKDQWLAAQDPAEFAYQVGKRQKELKSIGNLEEYKQRIERETRAKLEAEYKAKEEERRKLAADLPTSLNSARGSNPTRPVFNGPTPFDAILGR